MKRVGYWYIDDQDIYTDPKLLISHRWDISERLRVIQYVRNGNRIELEERGLLGAAVEMCCFGCRSPLGMETTDLTDGVWTWPANFAHYLESHSIKPPLEFLENVRNNLYRVPPPRPSQHPK